MKFQWRADLNLRIGSANVTEALWKTGKIVHDACKTWNQMLPRCAYDRCPRRSSIVNGFLRRGEGFHCNGGCWYCSPDCLELSLAKAFRQLIFNCPATSGSSSARLPIGHHFVLKGI